MMIRIMIVLICLLFLVGINPGYAQSLPTTIPITIPTHGYLTFKAELKLLMVDTYNGNLQILDEASSPSIVSDPVWNWEGDQIAYNIDLDVYTLNPFAPGLTKSYFPDDPNASTFLVTSWNSTDTGLLGIGIDIDSTYYDIQSLDLGDNSRIPLRRDFVGSTIPESMLLEFAETRRAIWNPVYGEWMAGQLITYPTDTATYVERPFTNVILVLNSVTGETHLLNRTMTENIYRLPPNAWSPNGRQILLETGEFGSHTQIVSVLDANGIWEYDLGTSAPDPHELNILGWLGSGDLFMTIEHERETNDQIYSIAQIIQGTLRTAEFFRLPVNALTTSPAMIVGLGSWHLTADDDERQTLSCLFDQALLSRLSTGSQARVITPSLDVWAEPTFEGTPITQLSTGTEITIIGSIACFNSADYYRLWQVQLADSTIGWAAESDITQYFLEPVTTSQPG